MVQQQSNNNQAISSILEDIVTLAKESKNLEANNAAYQILELARDILLPNDTSLLADPLISELDLLKRSNRIHGTEAYIALGLKVPNSLPEITTEDIKLCLQSPVRSMLVLDLGYSLRTVSDASVQNPSPNGYRLGMDLDNDESLADLQHSTPKWTVVPMHNYPDTFQKDTNETLNRIESETGMRTQLPEPRALILGILFHEMATGEKLFLNAPPRTTDIHLLIDSNDQGLEAPDGVLYLDRNRHDIHYNDLQMHTSVAPQLIR